MAITEFHVQRFSITSSKSFGEIVNRYRVRHTKQSTLTLKGAEHEQDGIVSITSI
jgi:hypothetical protein